MKKLTNLQNENAHIVPNPRNATIQLTPTQDAYGTRVALVLGNEYAGGSCPQYRPDECNHCDIGLGEGPFTLALNKERWRFLRDNHFRDVLPRAGHILIFNSGSVLHDKQTSPEVLHEVLDDIANFEYCKVVSLDSREMYVTKQALDDLSQRLRSDQSLRINLGIETQDDVIREQLLRKRGMTKPKIERVYELAGSYNGRVGIDVNVLFQPPGVVGEDAVHEAVETVKYCLDLAERFNIPSDFNFHPYYPSKKGQAHFQAHPRADIDDAKKALVRIKNAINARQSASKIYVGWDDEGHDQEPAIKVKELLRDLGRFRPFNETQRTDYLSEGTL